MKVTLTRADWAVRALQPGEHAYGITDEAGHLIGVVAGSGTSWTAGRIGPLRAKGGWFGCVLAETRGDALDALLASLTDGLGLA